MQVTDLKKKYPDIIKVCRERDCNYKEAIDWMEKNKGQLKIGDFTGG